MKGYIKRATTIGFSAGMAIASIAHAQSGLNTPVTIVVPYGPGGNADLAARALSFSFQNYKDSPPLIVVNRAGAGGITGSQFVVNAPRDGQTLLLARVGSQAVAPALDPATTYKWDSFTFLGLLETDPYACIVAKDSPYQDMKELLAAIKEKPGKLSYGTSGNMDASVVFPIKMLLNLGLSPAAALKVPYKSGTETVSAVLGGQVDFACNGLATYMGSITGGRTRALIVSTPTRVPQLPTVPTVEEIGMKNLEMVSGWSALYGPPELPKEIVMKWTGLLSRLSTDPKWIQQVKSRGSLPSILGPQETKRFVEGQFREYRALQEHMKIEK